MLTLRRFQHTFQRFDVAIVRSLAKPNEQFHLSQPLQPGLAVKTGNGPILHDDIIGKPYRSLLEAGASKYIVTKPTLEEYVVNRRREAQPIYALDAGMMVELSGICVDYPQLRVSEQARALRPPATLKLLNADDPYDLALIRRLQERKGALQANLTATRPPKQFLECGTGHGSLTLNILKEIHGGNAFYDGENDLTRGSILHSLDRSEKHIKVGVRNVKHYMRGMYWPDVEFHLTDRGPSEWLQSEISSYYRCQLGQARENEPFLSGAFLDMPSPELHLSVLSDALTVDSPIVVFVPSIMQLWDCLSHIKTHGVRLTLTKVCELMAGSGGGMREWDLRRVSVRETGQHGVVMRPKVGARIVGGGFIGVFRKLPNDSIVKKWD
ncbi:hypothetical protein HG536_0E04050 [Torulaspora globosa]|uniref:tRNA (adenine(58)-N(1))-methyltransferase catalytic subunit TRM61 n=1 Tax=Torulaspora globosa TaxID=48254 RepID=A0A7G3ZJ08_9SACH|nr:uncharacterized protein HG536_0E04050 [Torulaspora globosa]QLL33494.1 hypothetical protein HG536_0E04050 [Torulaspora globosa]